MASDPPNARDAARAAVLEKHEAPTDRDIARADTPSPQPTDADVAAEISQGVRLQHDLDKKKEDNRHAEVRLDKRIEMAPVTIAAAVVALGFIAFFAAMVAASWYGQHAEFWAKQGERGIGIATAALAYIFGKGSK
jgi:hypothetical protein